MSFITKKWKLVSLILLVTFCVLVRIGFSANRQSGELAAFNRLQEDFYDEYLMLQEERVRVAVIAHNGASHDKIINQLETMHVRAEKTYEVMIQMYETALEIEIIEEDEVSFFVTPVYAGSFQDFGKNVIWNLPLVGRLAHGFDTTTDSIRLGLYKAYGSGIVGDQEIIEELMREKGIETREELLTAPPKDITWIFSHARSTEASATVNNEVDLAEVAVKGGVSAVKAYFDGVLLVTGGKSIDIQSELLGQLGVSADLQSFIKMRLGETTGGEYLKDKAKEQFLELYEYVLTPEEITAIVNEDSEEIKAILARSKGMENEEQKETTKSILALSQKALGLAVEVAENSDIDENLPYHEWPLETQRELAQKLNVEEEKGPLVISAKTKSGGITQYLLPPGMWNILTSSKGTMPRYIYDVNKENGKTGSMISLTTRLANAKQAQTLLEQESLTYEKLEELGILTPEDITTLNSQDKKKATGISKLLQPLRNLLQYKQKNNTDKHVPNTNNGKNNNTCTENWICEKWDTCTNGIQNRVCSDQNKCGSVLKNGRPIRTIETHNCQNNTSNQSGGSNCSGDGSLLDQICSGQKPQQSVSDMPRVDTSLLDEEW